MFCYNNKKKAAKTDSNGVGAPNRMAALTSLQEIAVNYNLDILFYIFVSKKSIGFRKMRQFANIITCKIKTK